MWFYEQFHTINIKGCIFQYNHPSIAMCSHWGGHVGNVNDSKSITLLLQVRRTYGVIQTDNITGRDSYKALFLPNLNIYFDGVSVFISCDRATLFKNTSFRLLSVCMCVRPSVTPFSLCSLHRIIMNFSGVITIDRRDIHAKGQGHRG